MNLIRRLFYATLVVLAGCCPNYAPKVTSGPETEEIEEGSSYSKTLTATDANKKDVLTATISQTPSQWLSISPPTILDNSTQWTISGTVPEVDADIDSDVSIDISDGEAVVLHDYVINVIDVPPANEAPDTTVTKEFNDNGEVKYIFSGTDTDGSIDHIAARFNNTGNYQNFGNNTFALVPIIQGNNIVEAIAYDNEGLADLTPATDSFVSPIEEVAKEFIWGILAGRNETYGSLEREVLISLGESDNFSVDYLIRKNDGTDAIVNYTGYEKDLETELSNKGFLDSYGIPNLYLVRIPEDEIQSRLEDFINGGYN